MKNLLLPLLFCLLPWSHIVAGNVFESLSFQSRILSREVRYSIYLPDDYESSQRKYPVLYLLHGWTDDRARTQAEYRAIAGLSMGGYGSFLYTLHHPHLFGACVPLSAAVYTALPSVLEFVSKAFKRS